MNLNFNCETDDYDVIEDNSCYNAIQDFWRLCFRSRPRQKCRQIVKLCIARGTRLHTGYTKLLTHRSPRADGTSRTAQNAASLETAVEWRWPHRGSSSSAGRSCKSLPPSCFDLLADVGSRVADTILALDVSDSCRRREPLGVWGCPFRRQST